MPTSPYNMTTLGIGIDIIEVSRIKKCVEKYSADFLDRIFTKQEQEYCLQYRNNIPCFAARFSAKEATVKALGIGFGKEASWKDIEILKDKKGRPLIRLSSTLRKKFHDPLLLLSLSHTKEYATAMVVWSCK